MLNTSNVSLVYLTLTFFAKLGPSPNSSLAGVEIALISSNTSNREMEGQAKPSNIVDYTSSTLLELLQMIYFIRTS